MNSYNHQMERSGCSLHIAQLTVYACRVMNRMRAHTQPERGLKAKQKGLRSPRRRVSGEVTVTCVTCMCVGMCVRGCVCVDAAFQEKSRCKRAPRMIHTCRDTCLHVGSAANTRYTCTDSQANTRSLHNVSISQQLYKSINSGGQPRPATAFALTHTASPLPRSAQFVL